MNVSLTAILQDMRNGSHVVPMEPDTLNLDVASAVDKYVSPVLYACGFPGNIMAFIVWIQPRMRHSSGTYLASLALADLIFLFIHVMFELYKVWDVKLLNAPVVCELLPIVFMTTQYLSPLLVLAFTVERFIAICMPAKRHVYCTQVRAKFVCCSLAIFSFALGLMQGYFYVYNTSYSYCGLRNAVTRGGPISVWAIWTWVTEMIVFMCVPLLILLFNILIIKEIRRLIHDVDASSKLRLETTNRSLLAVSFYFIVTTLPVSIVYAIRNYFIPADNSDVMDVNRQQKYILAKSIIEEIGISHFACKFYIFLVAEPLFRREFLHVVRARLCLWKNDTVGYTQHTEQTTHIEWQDADVIQPDVSAPSETNM